MRVPTSTHTSHPWRIREITRDFRIEDVWEMRAPGRPDDVATAALLIAKRDPACSSSFIVRSLFALRWKLGALFGWDREEQGTDSRVVSLKDRLPPDLRARPGPQFTALPFTSLYQTADEFAAEIANRTMHGVMHIARVAVGDGTYRGLMTVYVKPNGWLGRAYMAAIRPFRHLIYPTMIRELERAWQARSFSN